MRVRVRVWALAGGIIAAAEKKQATAEEMVSLDEPCSSLIHLEEATEWVGVRGGDASSCTGVRGLLAGYLRLCLCVRVIVLVDRGGILCACKGGNETVSRP